MKRKAPKKPTVCDKGEGRIKLLSPYLNKAHCGFPNHELVFSDEL